MKPEPKTIANLTLAALTEASAQPTKEKQKIMPELSAAAKVELCDEWATWLKLKTHSDPVLENVVLKCRELMLAFKSKKTPRWISFLGDTGTGKTHCGRRLWNHISTRSDWRESQFIQREIYWPGFVSELRSGNAYDQFRDMMKWPVLFLDDIGAERDTTGFASEQLNTLLGCRMDKWTILTSNLFLDQLGGIDPRMADRIIRAPNIFVQVKTESHALRHAATFSQLPPSDR